MLKYQLDSLDGVDDGVKSLYVEQGGKFVLGIEGLPKSEDVSGLKAKVDELLSEKKAAKEQAAEQAEKARKAAEDAAKKGGDIEALEKSWQQKIESIESQYKGQIDQLTGSINSMTVDSVASKLASELALPGSADILIPHIKSRLAAEQREGKFVTVVKDLEGKPSASTIDDLKAEFTNNKAFAPVIVGSKASGGGANGANGGAGGQPTKSRSEFNAMPQHERAAFVKAGGKPIDD